MIVLDASVALELLLGTPRAAPVRDRLRSASERLHAPHLVDVEVTQVLRRYVRSGELSVARAEAALADLILLPLTRYDATPLLRRIWELRENLSAYDATYVALAEALDAPLLTCDAKLKGAPGHRARLELIA